MSEFQVKFRVYIEDTDAGGIVYYVNYLKYMERCRTDYLRHLGYGKAAVLEDGLLLVVKSANVEYLQAARLDDEITVTASLIKLARTYVIFHQQVKLGDNILCHADIKVACVSQGEVMKPSAIPQSMHQRLHSERSNETE